MHFFFALIFLLSSEAFAQKSLGRESFQINVRPVLNGILGDFYQMVSLFPNFPKEIVPVIKELDSITNEKETLEEICPRVIDNKCKDNLKSLRAKLSNLKSLSFALSAKQPLGEAIYLNSLTGIKILSDFDSALEEVKGDLDNAAYLLAAKIPEKRETYKILKDLDELNTLISLALVEFIPYTYRDDFRHFYFNFVHPIQQQISKQQNYEYINRNINSLNFSLNLLNMNLTKRNKKTPEGMGPYLAVLHNRWNSILRYYF